MQYIIFHPHPNSYKWEAKYLRGWVMCLASITLIPLFTAPAPPMSSLIVTGFELHHVYERTLLTTEYPSALWVVSYLWNFRHQQTKRRLCAFLRIGGVLFPDLLLKNIYIFTTFLRLLETHGLSKVVNSLLPFPTNAIFKKQLSTATLWRGAVLQQSEPEQKVASVLRWRGKLCLA